MKEKCEKGFEIKWFAGFKYVGYKRIRWNGKEWRYEGYDGTSNSYFFAPFNKRISKEQAIKIIKEHISTKRAVEFIKEAFKHNFKNDDEIYDYINSL